jgi:C-terminal processing protease CtpA/Prc
VIRGGNELNMPLYVIKLISGSSAAFEGRILIGDEIIQINGILTHNLKLSEAVELFKSKDSVRLLIKRTGLSPPSVSDFIDSMKNGLQV